MALVCHYGNHFRPQELPKKLTDYLTWLMIWGKTADTKEVGKSSHPAQNPPLIDGHSAAIITWYAENVTSFVKDHGLMEGLIQELRLRGEEKAITMAKMNIIYEMRLRQMRNAATEANSA